MARNNDRKSGAPEGRPNERQPEKTDKEPVRRNITGPGAADFLTASGGLDMPENDPAKGTRAAGEEATLTDERRLSPNLDEPRPTTEREIRPGEKGKDRGTD